METRYHFSKVEPEIYAFWERKKLFSPKRQKKKNFVICFPPPNVTGELHLGHALNGCLQDFLIRKKKMEGYNTLWVPGLDHAGIATQVKVEKKILKEEGKTRRELGKEEFLKRVWDWVKEYSSKIKEQLKRLGFAFDWSHFVFTLDKNYCKAVQAAFSYYWKKKWVYLAQRPINWCKRCQTALSDLEIEYKKEKGKLWYIKYPLETSNVKRPRASSLQPRAFIVVATTRPETMLGDTAVAVNPKDKRYKKLVGKKAVLPLVGREIPIIADFRVDPNFGTGAVKITPAHDFLDYQISLDHNLQILSVISKEGRMENTLAEFEALEVEEAREKIVKELQKKGFLEKIEDYEISLPRCGRCGTKIEILPTPQWFLKMKELAQKAKKAVKSKRIKFFPERFEKTFFDWIENCQDWCVSRQIWWGHQIPLWQCQNTQQHFLSLKDVQKCPVCKSCQPEQVEDVFDTWFSSALWPFAVFGWPQKTKDLKQFFPTDVIVTARDIINLWIARMIFSSLELTKKIPFKLVLVHPTILTKEGKRMSKSLGTGIDPLDLVEKYGADATRFSLFWQCRFQQDVRFDENVCLAGQKFLTKMWNAARFLILKHPKKINLSQLKLSKREKEILKLFQRDVLRANREIEKMNFGKALEVLYHSFWHKFCDLWIEESKKSPKVSLPFLSFLLLNYLKLLHPFLPFVTEKIYQLLPVIPKKQSILQEKWPTKF